MNYNTMMRSGQIFMKHDPDGELQISDTSAGMHILIGAPLECSDDVAELETLGWKYEGVDCFGIVIKVWVYR